MGRGAKATVQKPCGPILSITLFHDNQDETTQPDSGMIVAISDFRNV
jgi:hypothetical protein